MKPGQKSNLLIKQIKKSKGQKGFTRLTRLISFGRFGNAPQEVCDIGEHAVRFYHNLNAYEKSSRFKEDQANCFRLKSAIHNTCISKSLEHTRETFKKLEGYMKEISFTALYEEFIEELGRQGIE